MSIFSQIEASKPRSNTFDLSYDRKQSMDFGTLTPIHVQECVPGDKITMSTSQMLRMAPMVAPIMHQVNVYTHFFFVPNRILWDGWKDFITGGEDGLDATVAPFLTFDSSAIGGLPDYMGLPNGDGAATPIPISAIPFAAYQLIYDDYYRDQNLITKVFTPLVDGDNTAEQANLQTLRIRAWQHDYFTSALPWTQKGAEATIPLGTTAPVSWETEALQGGDYIRDPATGGLTLTLNSLARDATSHLNLSAGGQPLSVDNSHHLFTDLSTATAATINDLRTAFRLQEWLEKNARGGSRYIESIKAHFGVTSPDARLQRPEFLGGGSSPVTISEVLQTSANDPATEPTPLGTQAGHGISVGASNNFSYYCTEHGYIMGIMSVMPKPAYQDGIPKHFLKFDKNEYYWPEYANLGEQPIENKELWFGNDAFNDDVFGYTPRYAEYKFINSSVHGEFKGTLDFWQWGRIFSTRPALNQTFIECVPDNRIFAVSAGEKLYCHIHHRIKAKRLMPYFGTPRGV